MRTKATQIHWNNANNTATVSTAPALISNRTRLLLLLALLLVLPMQLVVVLAVLMSTFTIAESTSYQPL
jgi:hypothetical protein